MLKDQNKWLIKRDKEEMASYSEECATLAANGTPKRLWPKKPPHPLRGRKANRPQQPSIDYPPPIVHITCHCYTAAPPDVIVDLTDGPEDSEYEDFEDELDV